MESERGGERCAKLQPQNNFRKRFLALQENVRRATAGSKYIDHILVRGLQQQILTYCIHLPLFAT